MRAPCSKSRGRRPCAHEHAPVETSARLFACERCRTLVLICSCCDRGQIYCAKGCAEEARRQSARASGKRYQASKKGRLAHAARQSAYRDKRKNVPHQARPNEVVPAGQVGRCYRASWYGRRVHVERSGLLRKKKLVTHHGSPRRPAHDVVPANATATGFSHCHWCGRLCSPFFRSAFLRR
jgi:hypothetical protein